MFIRVLRSANCTRNRRLTDSWWLFSQGCGMIGAEVVEMTMEERIRQSRMALGYSQEYVAEQLGLSRQAVSKWESGKSSPDTKNLIALAELFGCSVQWLLTGEQPSRPVENPVRRDTAELSGMVKSILAQRRRRWLKGLLAVVAVVLLTAAAAALSVHFASVSRDAGACGGGFGTYIFDKYSSHLTGLYGQHRETGYRFEALRGTQEAAWEGRTITLSFDIRYRDNERGVVTDRVCFRGKRVWTETFRWRVWSAEQQSARPFEEPADDA